MSGGRFNYKDGDLSNDLFGWKCHAGYGLGENEEYATSLKEARRVNPMQDKELSELIFDVFCLLNSLDYSLSGDTCDEDYRKDVKYFKAKWLNQTQDERVKREIDKSLKEIEEELFKTFGEDF